MEERTWIQPGDRVRLTGHSWDVYRLQGEVVLITDIDLDGDPMFEHPMYGPLVVYKALPELDYSAERVES